MKWWRARMAFTSCGHDGVVVADDAGEERFPAPEALGQVLAGFFPDGAPANLAARHGRLQLAEGRDGGMWGHTDSMTREGPARTPSSAAPTGSVPTRFDLW